MEDLYGLFGRIVLKQKVTLKQYLIGAVIGLLGFAVPHMPFLYIILPAAYGLVGAAYGAGVLCFSLLISAAGAAFVSADMLSLVMYLPASLALGLMIYYKRPWRSTAAVTAGALFLGMYCVVCLPGVIAGTGPYGPIITMAKEIGSFLSAEFTALGAAEQAKMAEEIIHNYVAIVPDSLLATLLMTSMVWAGLSLIVVRSFLKKRRELRPMAPMREWRLPKGFVWGSLILLAGGLILSTMDLAYAAAVTACAEIIALLPLALQGVALCDFLWYVRRKSAAGRVIAIILLVLLLPTSVIFFAMMGFIEQLTKIRMKLKLAEAARDAANPPDKDA